MSNFFTLLLAREARLLCRRPAELANPLVFFAIVIALFPLAVGPESQLLQTLSPPAVLVNEAGGDGNAPMLTERAGGGANLRQALDGNAEEIAQFLIPLERVERHQAGARGGGHISCELTREPRQKEGF